MNMTNTERLIATMEHAVKCGYPCITFAVGKHTGNGPSVVEALRRRGYSVDRVPQTCPPSYILAPGNNT